MPVSPAARFTLRLCLPAALLLACVAADRPPAAATTRPAARPRPQAPEGVEFTPDVVYGKGGGEDMKLNLSRPKEGAGPFPCVLVIHGGGWAAGRREQHDDITWKLAQKGYVAATVSYRLAPKHPFPAQVEDVKCAVRYLRGHADKYGIDADRFGAIGFSAGAHLSMMLAVTTREDGLEGEGGWEDQSSRVQAAVSFFGPTKIDEEDIIARVPGILEKFIGGKAEEKAEAYRRASPVTYLKQGRSFAPMLLFQGTADPLVPPTQAYLMADAMGKAGAPGRVEILPGFGHGWGGAELERTADASFAFFDQHLKLKKPQRKDPGAAGPNGAPAPPAAAGK